MTMAAPPTPFAGSRPIGFAALAGAALIALFWMLYAARVVLPSADPFVRSFESAFPAADAVFATVLLAAGLALVRRRRSGPFLLVVGAAMSVYLGVLDFSFYAGRGFYWPMKADGALELVVNLLCVGGGLIALRVGWRLWGVRP